jgi:hypothetical protein
VRFAVVAYFFATLSAAGAARAEAPRERGRAPSPDADEGPHRFVVRGEAGVFGPAGFLGLTAGLRAAGPLVLEYSSGGGVSGWQHALLLRLRSATSGRSMSLALGPSVGWDFDEERAYFWGHAELAYVIDGHREGVGWHLLVGAGVTFFIARHPEPPAVPDEERIEIFPDEVPPAGPFFRFGGGWGI